MNMSYCRFQNTLSDLRDCAYALDDMDDPQKELSREAFRAFQSMVQLCIDIAATYAPMGTVKEARP